MDNFCSSLCKLIFKDINIYADWKNSHTALVHMFFKARVWKQENHLIFEFQARVQQETWKIVLSHWYR